MPAIDLKTAVSNAMAFVQGLYAGQSVRDLLLEEVELSKDGREWHVTIGFSLPSEGDTPFMVGARPQLTRHYKVIRVNATSGATVSMKIRELASTSR